MRTFFRDVLTTLIIAAVIFVGLQSTIKSIIVDGPSMNYSFHDGQRVLVNKVVYRLHDPERGDVIIFHPPSSNDSVVIPYIKRIIGLPGESVEIKGGRVYIHQAGDNVFNLNEPYLTEENNVSYTGNVIPEGEYFVLGDNRNNSDDSRHFGVIERQDIIGKAWLSIWPPEYWGLVANHYLTEPIDKLVNNK
jgi:signal peptidase I